MSGNYIQRIGAGVSVSAAFDPAVGADRSYVTNPDYLHQIHDSSVGTNVADGTYYFTLDLFSFKRVDFGLTLNASASAGSLTVTVEGAARETVIPGDIPAAEWIDISNSVYGSASWVASAGTSTYFLLFDETQFTGGLKWVRLKIVAAGGTNDLSYEVFSKRGY